MKGCPEITIHWYTLCYNEMDKLPFVVRYWENMADKVTVYDNGSTDGSVEYLKKFPFVDVRHFDSNNSMREDIQRDLKNSVWKESRGKADYVIVSDLDEVVWAEDAVGVMKRLKQGGVSLVEFPFVSVVSDHKLSADKFVHEQGVQFFKENGFYSHGHNGKVLMFSPNLVSDINYAVGAHSCRPRGKIVGTKILDGQMCTFHLDPLELDMHIRKNIRNLSRQSEVNKRNRWDTHYKGDKTIIENDFKTKFLKSHSDYKECVRLDYA